MQFDGSSAAGGPNITSASGISSGARQDHLRDVPLEFEVEAHRLELARGSSTPPPSGKSPPWFEQSKAILQLLALMLTTAVFFTGIPIWHFQSEITRLRREKDEAAQKQKDAEDAQKESKRVNDGLLIQHSNDTKALMSALGQIDLLKASNEKLERGLSEIKYILNQQDTRMIDSGIALSGEGYGKDYVEGLVQSAAQLAKSLGFGDGRISQQGMDAINGFTGQDRREAQAAKRLLSTVLAVHQDKTRHCISIIDNLTVESKPHLLLPPPPPKAVRVPKSPRQSGPTSNSLSNGRKERATQTKAALINEFTR